MNKSQYLLSKTVVEWSKKCEMDAYDFIIIKSLKIYITLNKTMLEIIFKLFLF